MKPGAVRGVATERPVPRVKMMCSRSARRHVCEVGKHVRQCLVFLGGNAYVVRGMHRNNKHLLQETLPLGGREAGQWDQAKVDSRSRLYMY